MCVTDQHIVYIMRSNIHQLHLVRGRRVRRGGGGGGEGREGLGL